MIVPDQCASGTLFTIEYYATRKVLAAVRAAFLIISLVQQVEGASKLTETLTAPKPGTMALSPETGARAPASFPC